MILFRVMTQKTISSQYRSRLHHKIINLCNEMELTLHDNYFGSKVYTNYQRVALIILYLRSGKSLRDFTSRLFESKWPHWLHLRQIVTKSTLQRWIKKFNLKFIRKLLSKISSKQSPSILAIDATGFQSWIRSDHYMKRLKDFGIIKDRKPHCKVDILVDVDSKIIHDFNIRVKPKHDIIGATSILKRLKHKKVLILGDRGYDSEPLHRLVIKQGSKLFVPIRDFKVKSPKGRNRKRCAIRIPEYGKRSIVENVIFCMKRKFRCLRSKHHYMKKREFGWMVITYNLEKLVKPIFWILSRSHLGQHWKN